MSSHRIACICAHCAAHYEKRVDRVCHPDYCSVGCRKKALAAERIKLGRNCLVCSEFFIPRRAQLRNGGGKYCSMKCFNTLSIEVLQSPEMKKRAKEASLLSELGRAKRSRKGTDNPQWRGGRYQSSGYIWQRNPGGWSKGEHRRLMESHLGRELSRDEVVHHINHDKTDNRLENLVVMTRAEHIKEHHPEIIAARRAVFTPRPQKLNPEKVARIRQMAIAGIKHVDIAKEFGVTPTNISLVVKGKIWGHV